ncbi:MAG: hypothetical protein JWN12_83 [Candidatus Saccharibacteria bacterium]|nr:hypothetical protein [Candidatus Saccharibacteria bacterium]
MSEETPTPQTESPNEEDNQSLDKHWSDVELMDRASQAAKQNFIDTPTPAEDPKGWSFGKKVGATIALAGAATLGAGVATVTADHLVPGQEVATATSTVYPGEGLEQSVDRDIKQIESQKIDPADTTERQDVISQAVDIHSDQNGIVQPGENVTVVAEKSPIFGNVTYKAVPNTDGTIPAPDTH